MYFASGSGWMSFRGSESEELIFKQLNASEVVTRFLWACLQDDDAVPAAPADVQLVLLNFLQAGA